MEQVNVTHPKQKPNLTVPLTQSTLQRKQRDSGSGEPACHILFHLIYSSSKPHDQCMTGSWIGDSRLKSLLSARFCQPRSRFDLAGQSRRRVFWPQRWLSSNPERPDWLWTDSSHRIQSRYRYWNNGVRFKFAALFVTIQLYWSFIFVDNVLLFFKLCFCCKFRLM